ncbi:hypothetical protein AAKU64_002983 [Undibacterium sp. GrIS 1.8]|uniref:hypothetical protein n=1 Tax=unclassified Undibacterium TaxID=2630295 RepID=UPI003397946D
MPKNQIKLFVVYAICMMMLMLWIEHSTRYHALREPLGALFGAWLPIGLSIFGIQNGWVIGKFSIINRDNSPISFWIIIAAGFMLGVFLLYRGVSGLLR